MGGKGSIRRKKQVVHKAGGQDDKRIQSSFKRMGMNSVPGIEEVNMFKGDGEVVHFANPKVQAAVGSNMYVITGANETKPLTDMLPGIVTQLGPDNLAHLKNIVSNMSGKAAEEGADDDVPDVSENFDEVN